MNEKNTETTPLAETNQKHRPRGLMQLVVVWLLFGVYNLYVSLNGIKLDWEAFSLLWSLPEWLRFAVQVEFALNVAAFIVSLVSIVIIYGLWTGKVWSDRLALSIPLSITIINILTIVLYSSAPYEVRGNLIDVSILGVTLYSAFATVMSWRYLRQAEVKEYMHSKRISLRDIAFVVFLIAITVGSAFVVQAIVEGGQPAQPPGFNVINVDKTWNIDGTQLTCRVEVQNVGGDGWNTLYFRYMETEEGTGDFWTETKQWRTQLNNKQTQIITFVFNRHSTNAISYIVDWWFTY